MTAVGMWIQERLQEAESTDRACQEGAAAGLKATTGTEKERAC